MLYSLCLWCTALTLSVLKKWCFTQTHMVGAQWFSGRMLDSRPRGCGFEPHRRHCIVSLSKNINPSLVLVQPRKTRPFITERLLMGRKESNQTNQTNTYLKLQRYTTLKHWFDTYHDTDRSIRLISIRFRQAAFFKILITTWRKTLARYRGIHVPETKVFPHFWLEMSGFMQKILTHLHIVNNVDDKTIREYWLACRLEVSQSNYVFHHKSGKAIKLKSVTKADTTNIASNRKCKK